MVRQWSIVSDAQGRRRMNVKSASIEQHVMHVDDDVHGGVCLAVLDRDPDPPLSSPG